jgi:hypothetical protein
MPDAWRLMPATQGTTCLAFFGAGTTYGDEYTVEVVCQTTPLPSAQYLAGRGCDCFSCNNAGIDYGEPPPQCSIVEAKLVVREYLSPVLIRIAATHSFIVKTPPETCETCGCRANR